MIDIKNVFEIAKKNNTSWITIIHNNDKVEVIKVKDIVQYNGTYFFDLFAKPKGSILCIEIDKINAAYINY